MALALVSAYLIIFRRTNDSKKLLAITIALLILSPAVSAEVICLKNGRKFSVSPANKVNIKANQFITIAENTCPTGYTALVDVQKEPTVYTGAWNLPGTTGQAYAAWDISFPQALDAEPTAVIFVEASTNHPTCTGSALNPTAPAGVLCIYEGYQEGLRTDFSQRYDDYHPGKTGDAGASRFGAAFYGYRQVAADYYAWGTWAITIP